MEDNIILFPEFEKLKTEVEMLRTELSMLVLERDELRFVECKNIEMAYMLKLGALEYKAYEAQCTYLRIKRKVDLIQAKKNRQEPVDLAAIDDALDIEFAEYQKTLNEQIDKMNKAIDRSQGDFLSAEETAELKKLYRRIVKALHPDLHPDFGEEKAALFDKAIKAYENGDLNTLRIIDVMVSGEILPEIHEDALQTLIKERDRLKTMIQGIQESITAIKNEYPYTMKELISDEEKTAERKAELEEILDQFNNAISAYQARIEEMVR